MSTTNNARTITPIDGTNGRFEWYQYNDDLRIIHCVEDDTFHAGSILRALGSKKQPSDWLRNKQTVELFTGFMTLGEFSEGHLVKEIPSSGANKGTYGTYIHRLLVNHFAMWVSPKYAYKISLVLDDHFELQRQVEENRALEDKNKTLLQKVDEILADNRKTHQKLDETKQTLNETKQQLTDANHKLDTIKADMRSIAPVASGLTNRISSPLSEEYLLINYTENDNGTVNVTYNAVNPTTIKRLKLNVEDSWLHQRFANSVDAQNRLIEMIEQEHLNIGRINRRAKSLIMNIVDLENLTNLVTDTLPTLLNKESAHIKNKANKDKETPPSSPSEKQYMGYPLVYCKRMCKRYSITMEILTEIINKEYTYGLKKYPIRLHPTDGIVYGKSINGKRRWYILKDNTFHDD